MPLEFARAAVGYGGRIVWARAADDDRLVPLLESALARLPEEELVLRSRLLARLAGALRDDPVPERRRALTAEAIELARRSHNPQALANALDSRVVSIQPAPGIESLKLADELLEVVMRSGDRERAIHGHVDRAYAHFQLGEVEAGRQALATATGIAKQLRQPTQLWFVLASDACIAVSEGRFAYGQQLMEVARTTGMHAQPHDALATYALHRYTLCEFQGRLEDAEPIVRDAVANYPARPVFLCALAHLYARRGDFEKASRLLQDLARDDFAGVPVDPDWLCAASFLVEACAVLEHEQTARTLHRLMRPFVDWNVSNLPEAIRGAAARYLALAAAAAGDRAEAERMFGAAIEMNERMGFRPWLAYTQEDFARFLLAEDPHATRARELLGAAVATYRGLGMRLAAERAVAAAPVRAEVGRP
jgi:ATP/maltotriose-dependent transcriptional regulator MalT